MSISVDDLKPNTWYWFISPEGGGDFIPVYSDYKLNTFVGDDHVMKKHLELGTLFQAIMPY